MHLTNGPVALTAASWSKVQIDAHFHEHNALFVSRGATNSSKISLWIQLTRAAPDRFASARTIRLQSRGPPARAHVFCYTRFAGIYAGNVLINRLLVKELNLSERHRNSSLVSMLTSFIPKEQQKSFAKFNGSCDAIFIYVCAAMKILSSYVISGEQVYFFAYNLHVSKRQRSCNMKLSIFF
jgi:hypothetical protein